MLIKTRGIVLKTRKYSESSVIANIYTEEKGLRSYIISGVRSKKAKVSAGLLQIMSIVSIVAYHREGKSLTRLKEIKPEHIYSAIPFNISRGAIGMFMVELAHKTIHGEEAQEELFKFLLDNFIFLDQTNQPVANLHLHFMVNLTEHLGFLPSDAFSPDHPYFDLREGHFRAGIPVHTNWLSPEIGEKFSQLLQLPLSQCHNVPFNRAERKSLLQSLLDYYHYHIENLPTIHSHKILEEVLG